MTDTDPDDDALADWIGRFVAGMPYCRALDMTLTEYAPGRAGVSLRYDPRFMGDPATGVLHGGVVSALMDTACWAAIAGSRLVAAPEMAATLDMRIDYMRRAEPGQSLTARAECVHVTRSIAFARADAVDGVTGTPVATATAAFAIAGLQEGRGRDDR